MKATIPINRINKVLKNNKNKFPQHTWIHYNKYNYQYNCNLHIVDTWPNLPNNIDTVIAFSVFTHTTFEEYQYTTSKLQQHLSNDGNILSTFFSSLDKKTLYSVLSHRPEYFKDCQEDIVDKLFKKDVIKIKKMSFKKSSGNVNFEVPYLDLNNKIV